MSTMTPDNNVPLAIVIATKPAPHAEHVSTDQELWLLKNYNCSLMNNGLHVAIEPPETWFPDAKYVIPIFGYLESWSKAKETYDRYDLSKGNIYWYNCGGTIDGESWNGLDEPGTRVSDPNGLFAMYEQARSELRMVKALAPGLKRVVTHPWPMDGMPEARWLNPDVAAWRLTLMENHMADYADRVAAIPELWAYLIDADFEAHYDADDKVSFTAMIEWASTIGPRVRAVGATTLLINDVSLLKYLFDYERGRLTDVGRALFEGVKAA